MRNRLIRHFNHPALSILNKSDQTTVQTEVCLEYKPAQDMICISESLMRNTKVLKALQIIELILKKQPLKRDFSTSLMICIAKAYNIDESKVETIKSQQCLIERNLNLYSLINRMYNDFDSARRSPLHAAIEYSHQLEHPQGLVGILNLLAHGGAECQARRNMAFNTFIQRIDWQKICESLAIIVPDENKKTSQTQITNTEIYNELLKNETFIKCAAIFRATTEVFLDDWKSKAFKSAFLEPAKFLFNLQNDHVMRDDVDVHGGNTYAAVLSSTLGVQLPFLSYFRDEVKGCGAIFSVEPELKDFLKSFTQRNNFGKSYPCIGSYNGKHRSYVNSRQFIVGGRTPRDVANAAVDNSESNRNNRQRIAEYLENFASCFKDDFILEPLFLRLRELHLKELEEVFQLLRDSKSPLLDTSENVTELFYTEDYEFRLQNAKIFFFVVGVTKQM